MPASKSRRRPPPLLQALAWFVPGLIAVAIAALDTHPLTLVPLLLANALTMAAVCHAIGFDPEPRFGRTVLRRGAAHLVMFTAYVALVFVLVAWPLLQLTQAHSLNALLLLVVALVVGLGALWRIWPAFGLAFVWDDAYPAQSDGSWIFTATARCLTFGKHLSREERFFTHFLPAALSLLLLAFMAIALTGLYGLLPAELRIAALAIYGVVLLPLGCLVVANRTLRALLCETAPRRAAPITAEAPAKAPVQAPVLSEAERTAGSAEQSTGLLEAARQGDTPRALALLEAGADPDTHPAPEDPDQRSVLMLAALLPDTRLLRALIVKGARLNPPHRGLSVLLSTVRYGDDHRAEPVMILLTNGADVTAADAEGNTALHYAARRGDLAIAAMLIDAEAPLDVLNSAGQTPLAIASHTANWRLLELILQRRPALQPEGGEPALIGAAGIAEDDPRGVALLLKQRAQVNARNAMERSALIAAAQLGHVRIVRALLTAHADVSLADRHGTTALMEAAHRGSEEIVRLLCDAGAPVDARDRHGRDALTLACLSSHASPAVVHALLDAGADPSARSGEEGQSAIDCAAAEGRWDLLAILDPEAPLPETAAGSEPDESPGHLLDALRFGHWNIVAGFAGVTSSWPASELAGLYVELAGTEHLQARRWLLAQKLAPEQRLDSGVSLFNALLEKLPSSRAALVELLDAGASPTGAGRLATAMEYMAARPEEGTALIARMLDQGADPFGPLADGRTPLHLAASVPGWLLLLQRLADLGCNPNARDLAGRTPLHDALEHPTQVLSAIRCLIGAGADPEAASANGETPLGLALAHEASDSERWLRWSRWPLPRRKLRAHDLPAAAAAGDLDAVDRLLELGFPVDALDHKGSSALIHACGLGHEAVAIRLLDAGANLSLATPSGITALAAAGCARQLELIRVLVQHEVTVDQRLSGDTTALMLVCAVGHPDAAEALADAGADVNAADAQGHTPLHAAAQYCFGSHDSLRARRLLDVLLSRRADPNAADRQGMTPLLLLLGAHQKPGVDCDATHLGALVPVLLDAGARHDHADQRGVTALHACAMHLLLPAARALLARGADRSAVDAFGRSAADVARLLGYVDLAAELAVRSSAGSIPSVSQTLRQQAD